MLATKTQDQNGTAPRQGQVQLAVLRNKAQNNDLFSLAVGADHS